MTSVQCNISGVD